MNKNDLASKQTVEQILVVARRHFATKGYAKTSLEEIVTEIGMTRGALYHHFKNKKSLFIAVLMEVQEDVGNYVEEKAMTSKDPWEQLVLGCVAFIEAAVKKQNRQILLLDAPSVIEWDYWLKLDQEHSFSSLEEKLATLKDKGLLVDLNLSYMSHLISVALNDLALYLAHNDFTDQTEMHQAVGYLLKGFKL